MTAVTSSTVASPTDVLSPTFFDDGPTDSSRFNAFAAATSASVSAPTGYGSSTDNSQQGDRNPLNFYFLILAVFIICAGILYIIFVRRRRNNIRRSSNNRQNALAQDVQGRPGGRTWGVWRTGTQEPKPEEGLDERGEPPPPYMPKFPPPAAHPDSGRGAPYNSNGGTDIPLQDLSRHEDGKPPEYSTTEDGAGIERPTLSRAGSTSMGSSRNLLSTREV